MTTHIKYFKISREPPEAKSTGSHGIGFHEVTENYSKEKAIQQASRCIDCGNPYCQFKCPLYNYIPDWCELLSEGRLFEAADMVYRTNPLPEICGRICPQDKLCEGSCTLTPDFGAVSIGNIERYITDQAIKEGWKPNLDIKPTGHQVAIVGAGPAGLSCADFLAREGIRSTVFDRHPEIGGLLSFGIPAFKLEKEVVRTRRAFLENLGIEFQLNCTIGQDIAFAQLLERYDAVFLGTGAYDALSADIGEADCDFCYPSLNYLTSINHFQFMGEKAQSPLIDFKDQRVVVLGGGDTAMDCTRSAIRQDARHVTCVYRRDQINMPGSERDFTYAQEEGVQFLWQKQAVGLCSEAGQQGINVVDIQLGQPDDSGRRRPEVKPNSESFIAADVVVIAYGFNASPADWFSEHNIAVNEWGQVAVTDANHTTPYQTQNPKVFAGGDNVRGSDLVVTAAFDGREAAKAMARYLTSR